MSHPHFSENAYAGALAPRHLATATGSVNVVEMIDGATIGRPHILVLTGCSVAAIFDGFDLPVSAFTGPVIAQQWRIKATAQGLIFSAALVEMTFGALRIGLLRDQCGRKVAVGLRVAICGWFP